MTHLTQADIDEWITALEDGGYLGIDIRLPRLGDETVALLDGIYTAEQLRKICELLERLEKENV